MKRSMEIGGSETLDNNTAAIRFLEEHHLSYSVWEYPENGPVAAVEVAAYFGLGDSANRLFKTLVTSDHKGGYYVFCLPGEKRLDLKKAAALVGVKNMQMLRPDVFEELTGYVHGGCSPLGMKTKLPTIVDQSAFDWDTIYISGGRVGLMAEIDPAILETVVDAKFEDITKE